MAGGKETPRQKMIGLMYLVLTAMLALNVSSAILLKFQFLDDSLMSVNRKTVTDNTGVVGNIKSAVVEGGNRPSDQRVLASAAEIREKTSELIKYMQELRDQLIETTGGKEEGYYKAPEDTDGVARLMLGPANQKNGAAYELEQRLNAYAQYIRQHNPNTPEKLALSGKEDEVAKNDPTQRRKNFAQLNFEETPMVAALAVIAQKQNEVLKYEADALSELAKKVGADIIKFEKIFAMARAESKTVAAGTKYKADMFIAASSDAITPKMTFQGRPIKVENGKGIIEFTAAASNYDANGNSKQTWKGQVIIDKGNGQEVLNVEEEYVVAKPVIQVQSAAVQALYLGCANELNIQVPALGAVYDPSFSASGGSAVKGSKRGFVTIIPSSSEVKINVSSGGNAIGSETFKVRRVPKAELIVYVNGKPVDGKRGVQAGALRGVKLDAVAEEGFKQLLPNDARYRVTRWKAYLVRGTSLVEQAEFSSPEGNLSSLAQKAQKGDRVALEIVDVKRLNYQGRPVDAQLGGDAIINIPLN